MLTSLALKNFTVFRDAEFQFAPGLNVIVGENGAGKSHVLKAAYVPAWVASRGERDSGSPVPRHDFLEPTLAQKLRGVFRPDRLGRLVTRRQKQCKVEASFSTSTLGFSFESNSESKLHVAVCPTQWHHAPAVFFPTRELLTIYPGFVSLYETTSLSFEETWRDTCLLLGAPVKHQGFFQAGIDQLLAPLEEELGGKVELEDGRFYIKRGAQKFEMHLVAEGFRKLAMIARLVATGLFVVSGAVFWDEPEANLNPKIIKRVARTILELCRLNVQVFLASHSLFLIRELDILLRTPHFEGVSARFFGLHIDDHGVTVQQGASIDDVGDIDALQEELSQSDRYLESEAP